MNELIVSKNVSDKTTKDKEFDLETLYVECVKCGRPLIWEKGTTTFLLEHSGIDQNLSSEWLLLSKGCPSCCPGHKEFTLSLARPEKKHSHPLSKKIRYN